MSRHLPPTRVFCQETAELGESPVWCPTRQCFFWVDILGNVLLRADAEGRNCTSAQFQDGPCGIVPAKDGSFAITLGHALSSYDPETGGTGQIFTLDLPSDVRFNDMKADRSGHLWIGTMARDGSGLHGEFLRLDHKGMRLWRDAGFAVTNGPAFSADGKFGYIADSIGGTILRYTLAAETGQPVGRDVFCRFAAVDGLPDGMTTDREGNLWVAMFGGGKVVVLSPRGDHIREVPMPVPQVTSLCFGGAGLDRLIVTSARMGMTEAELRDFPDSGKTFMVEVGPVGRAADLLDPGG